MMNAQEDLVQSGHLEALARPYGLGAANLRFLRYSQNHVYACQYQGRKAILRITEDRHRTVQQVQAELAWIHFLADKGLRVCRPILSECGQMCVTKDLGGKRYIATCFEHAPGEGIARQHLTPELYQALGELLGKLHSLTAAHHAMPWATQRPHWHASRLLRQDRETLRGALTKRFSESVDDLVRQLQELPTGGGGYGLVHADFSLGNCHLDGKHLWLFDFDNCEQGHFAQDVATVLYDSIYCKVLNKFADDGLNARMAGFWQPFWQGYCKSAPAQPLDIAQLKKFFLLREAIIYMHYHRVLDLRQMEPSFHAGLEVMRKNVEDQVHQADFSAVGV